uniref:Uncharacterized protein n=1 Tax=viral metagenome TaxID=1070528 RepID=A0A6C0DXF3_9ZZZZ
MSTSGSAAASASAGASASNTAYDTTPVPVPEHTLIFFFFMTLGFAIFTLISIQNSKTIDDIEKTKDASLLTMIYLFIVVLGSYFINTTTSKALCSSSNIKWTSILLATLLPWIIIFLSLYMILKAFPGWVAPFSNTLGYLVIKILGVEEILSKLLNKKPPEGDNSELVKAISNISNNKSNFINQIDIEKKNFYEFIEALQNDRIFATTSDDGNSIEDSGLLKDLYKLLVIKNVIGKVTWYALTGVLVSSVSYNYIINMSCEKTIDDINRDLAAADSKAIQYQRDST